MKNHRIKIIRLSIMCLFTIVLNSVAETPKSISQNEVATLRQGTALNSINEEPARLMNPNSQDIKRGRAYPMQPPTIPHKIDGYEVNLKANTCLRCHARTQAEESQAPMISVTHFMDRDGNFLADVSPRRYFCQQCHVTQLSRKDLVENTFKDVHELIASPQSLKEK